MPFSIVMPFKKPIFNRVPKTLARVLEYRDKEPSRIDFKRQHTNALKRKSVPSRPDVIGSFSLPFAETVKPIFEADTGLKLFFKKEFDNYWISIQSEGDFATASDWVEAQGSRLFLRDCLDLSVALDCNREDPISPTHTHLGDLEQRAKHQGDPNAVAELSNMCAEAIRSLPYFRDAEFVVAVPPMSAKRFDLPSQIAAHVSARLSKQDLTGFFACANEKQTSLKEAPLEEKWAILEATGLRLNFPISNESDVILIDDKYQSGTTMQFVAMKLQEAGARYIFGISLVKTLRDTDNAS